MKKLVLIIIYLWIANSICFAQTTVSSSGNYQEGTNATLSWTIGEPITETISGTNSILNSGMQQNFSFTIVSVYEKLNSKVNISVYPNPAVDFLNISIENSKEQFEISIFDVSGKNLMSKKVSSEISKIDIKNFAESNYFLKITNQNGEEIKTYKIVKSEK
jgi:protease II